MPAGSAGECIAAPPLAEPRLRRCTAIRVPRGCGPLDGGDGDGSDDVEEAEEPVEEPGPAMASGAPADGATRRLEQVGVLAKEVGVIKRSQTLPPTLPLTLREKVSRMPEGGRCEQKLRAGARQWRRLRRGRDAPEARPGAASLCRSPLPQACAAELHRYPAPLAGTPEARQRRGRGGARGRIPPPLASAAIRCR